MADQMWTDEEVRREAYLQDHYLELLNEWLGSEENFRQMAEALPDKLATEFEEWALEQIKKDHDL